jgi:hypothetical protein
MQPTAQAVGSKSQGNQEAPKGRKKRLHSSENAAILVPRSGRARARKSRSSPTGSVELLGFANHPNKLSREKTNTPLHFFSWLDINNEPRATVWLAGRYFATLVRVRHLMI